MKMKYFKIFLIVATVLVASGVSLSLPQEVLAWTPTLTSVAFQDFDGDGTVDRLKVTFDFNVTQCKFEAGDWTITPGSIGLTGPAGRLNGIGGDYDCDGTTNYFYLLVSGDTGETGYPGIFVPADIQYKNLGTSGSVAVLGVTVPNQSIVNIDDNASPVIVSTVPAAGSTGVSVTTSYISVTFSEPMMTGTVTASISAGTWGPPSWSSDNKILTRSRLTTLPYDTAVTVTTSGEDKGGYLLTDGVSPALPAAWSFRTAADPTLVSASQSTVSASPTSITADGSSTSTITVTVKNSAGSVLSGKTVSLSSNRGGTDTIVTVAGTTDALGKAYFQVRSNSSGSATFTAVAAGTTISQTAIVTFTSPAPGPVSASRSSVYATPASVVANNSDYSTVTVTARDASDNLLSGKTVSLSSSRGATDTISIVGGVTNSSGLATFQVKSGTPGAAILTATSDGTTISQTVTVTFTAVPAGLIYGDLFKESGSTAVYYYASNGKRYVFPTQAIYFSWYSDFSTIKTVSHSQIIAISLGGNVLAKPGTYLVQFVSMDTPFRVLDPKVYVLTAAGQLRWVTTAGVASSLYGADWERKIIAVPEVYKTNYGGAVPGADVVATSDYSKASVEATVRTISDLY